MNYRARGALITTLDEHHFPGLSGLASIPLAAPDRSLSDPEVLEADPEVEG